MDKSAKAEDQRIGANIRRIRKTKGLSQEKLGDALALTFQQVQKYEKGTNRVSGSRIIEMSRALGVPVNALFDGIDFVNGGVPYDPFHEFQASPEAVNFVTALLTLKPEQRKGVLWACTAIVEMVRKIS